MLLTLISKSRRLIHHEALCRYELITIFNHCFKSIRHFLSDSEVKEYLLILSINIHCCLYTWIDSSKSVGLFEVNFNIPKLICVLKYFFHSCITIFIGFQNFSCFMNQLLNLLQLINPLEIFLNKKIQDWLEK